MTRQTCTQCNRTLETDDTGCFCIFCFAATPDRDQAIPVSKPDRRRATFQQKPSTSEPGGILSPRPVSPEQCHDRALQLAQEAWAAVAASQSRPEADYDTTPHVVGGYRVWWRGYTRSIDNDLLVGCWLAWPEPVSDPSATLLPFLVSLCGHDFVGPYLRGSDIPHWSEVSTNRSTRWRDLRQLKDAAFVRMMSYLETHGH